MVTKIKRDFLSKISSGIQCLMTSSYLSDEIALQPFGNVEEIIARKFIAYEAPRHLFSCSTFDSELDIMPDSELIKFLLYLDDVDIYIKRVYSEAYLSYQDMNKEEYILAKMIEDGKVLTFKEFLEIKD
jgi:hypothetical protein